MAREPETKPRLRLFVALDLPDALREGIAAWSAEELSDPALGLVAAEALHITLAFLGHRDASEVDPVAALTAASVAAAPEIELLDPEPRPRRGQPRLFALPVRSEGAVALRGGV